MTVLGQIFSNIIEKCFQKARFPDVHGESVERKQSPDKNDIDIIPSEETTWTEITSVIAFND